jgi:hypothetical protein
MNGLLDNLALLWRGYYFVYLGIIIVALAIVFFLSKISSGIFWYYRFRERNWDMEQLAKDFNFSFESHLSSLPGFILKSIFHNIEINDLRGSVQNHSIEIKDIFRSLTTLFTIASPPFPGSGNIYFSGGNRQTAITVDGQNAKGSFVPLSLANPYTLTPIDELRNFLKAQAG